MGNDEGDYDEAPEHIVKLDSFWIDVNEVTAGDYQTCLDAGACSMEEEADFCTVTQGLMDHPVNCVTWQQANDYCELQGKRLPTEAEWEKAARGTDERLYPWGSKEPDCAFVVMEDANGAGCGAGGPHAVGERPSGASPYGALDMAGNVAEWCSDWHDSTYYEESPVENPQGPDEPSLPEGRVIRGGHFGTMESDGLTTTARSRGLPDSVLSFVGFRCVEDAQ